MASLRPFDWLYYFYAPEEGHHVFELSVRQSVHQSVSLSVAKNFNLAHNFLISEWIHFIFGHNIPWDKSFQLPSSVMTLTQKWP